MTTFERRFSLLRLLREKPGLRVQQLARLLSVSEGTVRNDIRALAEDGQLTRVWGGAVPSDDAERTFAGYATRRGINAELKAGIAREAAAMVQDGDAIMMDASSTVFAMAAFLQDKRNLTVVTNGIDVGREMARNPANIVVLLGGILRTDGTAVTRPLSEGSLHDLHIRTAFMSASGFTPAAGLTEEDFHEAQFKRAMVNSANKLIALVDSSKFGRTELAQYAPTQRISQLISDGGLSHEARQELDALGIRYKICGFGIVKEHDERN